MQSAWRSRSSRSKNQIVRSAKEVSKSKEFRREMFRDALLLKVHMEYFAEMEDPQGKVFMAYRIGRMHEKLLIRLREHFARIGKQVSEGGKLANERVYGTIEQKSRRNEELVNRFSELPEGLSRDAAAKRLGVSRSTLYRALKKFPA